MTHYTQLAFLFDQSKCTGCKACQIACKDKHDLPVSMTWRRVPEYSGGSWSLDQHSGTARHDVWTYFTSVSCNHCDDPICVEVCPSTAMHKGAGGIVAVDPALCIGCKYCAMACPYEAPQFDATTGKMSKCDFCADRIAAGRAPACVEACPTRALDYGEAATLRSEHGTQASLEPLPEQSVTRPNLVIIAHRRAQPSGRGTGRLANPREI